jgi:hypothetical protein
MKNPELEKMITSGLFCSRFQLGSRGIVDVAEKLQTIKNGVWAI